MRLRIVKARRVDPFGPGIPHSGVIAHKVLVFVPFLTTTPPLARALAERNYIEATPVQTAVLAPEAAGRDLLVSAQTGSGKTVAYGLAIASNLLGDAERFAPAAAPLALIVAPTRELALQVHRELGWLYRYAGARVVSCVGGMDPRREQRELAEGAHIVVGTPGRLCDHLRRGRLDVSELKAVVLDEADEMLDLGFREDMEFILKTTPDTRRTLLFSATLPRGIVALAKTYQHNALPRRSRRRRGRPRRHRISRDPDRAERRRTRRGQRAALHRIAQRHRVLQHPQRGQPSADLAAWSAASRWWRCPAN